MKYKSILLASLAIASASTAFSASLHNCFRDSRSYTGTGGLTSFFASCVSGNETNVNDEVGTVYSNLGLNLLPSADSNVKLSATRSLEVSISCATGGNSCSVAGGAVNTPHSIATLFQNIADAQVNVTCVYDNSAGASQLDARIQPR